LFASYKNNFMVWINLLGNGKKFTLLCSLMVLSDLITMVVFV
jgi:hypothetical protein